MPRVVTAACVLALFASGCGDKDADRAKAAAEINAACEKLVKMDEGRSTKASAAASAARTSPSASAPQRAPDSESILGDLREIVDGLGASAPASVSEQTRCAADLHLYRHASEKGFACVSACANEGELTRTRGCVKGCVAEDEVLEKARRAARAQRELTGRGWLGSSFAQPTTRTTGRLAHEGGGDVTLTLDLPDDPQVIAPGHWRIAGTGATVAPTVRISLQKPSGDPRASALQGEDGRALREAKEREATEKHRYMLLRVGPNLAISREGAASQHRDHVQVDIVWDDGPDRLVCTVTASMLGFDDGLVDAVVAWADKLCGSVALQD